MTIRSDLGALAVAAIIVLAATPADAQEPAAASSDALESLRERFRAGMDRYRAGAFAEAIVIWSGIYSELGPEKGYRIAFNLAEAYDQLGESASQAAELYEAYLTEVSRRRTLGETLEPLVEKQELEAKAHLAELAQTKGRLELTSYGRPVAVRIDDGPIRITSFVAYVAPAKVHVVTWNPGASDEKKVEVTVGPGQRASLLPPTPPPPAPMPTVDMRFETRTERPFSATYLYVAAGVTALSTIVPIVLYANASSTFTDYKRENGVVNNPTAEDLSKTYEDEKTATYVSYVLPATFAAATLGLAAYWLWGGKEVRVPVSASILPDSVSLGATRRF